MRGSAGVVVITFPAGPNVRYAGTEKLACTVMCSPSCFWTKSITVEIGSDWSRCFRTCWRLIASANVFKQGQLGNAIRLTGSRVPAAPSKASQHAERPQPC